MRLLLLTFYTTLLNVFTFSFSMESTDETYSHEISLIKDAAVKFKPSYRPTRSPTRPKRNPTIRPTRSPTRPTRSPTYKPTSIPTSNPTTNPITNPTIRPSSNPTKNPTRNPTRSPTTKPNSNPVTNPTSSPIGLSTAKPTTIPLAIFTIDISADPYTTTSSYHATQVEPDNFAYGNTVVAATQTGRFYDGGCDNICWAMSNDSAVTWTSGCLKGVAVPSGGTFQRVSDPTVAYDLKHNTWLIAYLLFNPDDSGSGVGVSQSTDGGLTWSSSTTVVTQFTAYLDKDWIVCDNTPTSPYYGNCYVQVDTYYLGTYVYMSKSSDGGRTWASPVRATSSFGIGGQPLVQPGGVVIMPFCDIYQNIVSVRSLNGGASWVGYTTVAVTEFYGSNGALRHDTMPSAEIDGSGKVYAVWSDCRFRTRCSSSTSPYDLVYSTSSDGLAWTSPVRIPITTTSSSMSIVLPGIAVDKKTSGAGTRLAVTYYYFSDSTCGTSGRPACQLYVGFISSKNAGATWSAPVTLAGPMSLNWLPPTSGGYMVGDYISTTFLDSGNAVPAFSNAKFAVNNGKLNQNLATVRGGIPV